jgi:hypothetical protein
MAEPTVAIADFRDPLEAALARNRLEAEGIPAFLVDASAAGVFSGMGIAAVKLHVPERDLARARAILASPGEDPLMRRMSADIPLPMETAPAWTYCHGCGSEVSTEFDNCPSCGKAVEVREHATLAEILAKPPHKAPAEREPAKSADADRVDRAWRAALFGLIPVPPFTLFFHLYSFWLLLRTAFNPGNGSQVSWVKFLGAFGIDMVVFVAVYLLLRSLLAFS